MATFITRMPSSGDGIRLAVKDLIDVAGVPTTAGSRALANAAAAERDAPCLAGTRAAGARIVGKANLDELAFGASGVNEYFGTPVNQTNRLMGFKVLLCPHPPAKTAKETHRGNAAQEADRQGAGGVVYR